MRGGGACGGGWCGGGAVCVYMCKVDKVLLGLLACGNHERPALLHVREPNAGGRASPEWGEDTAQGVH